MRVEEVGKLTRAQLRDKANECFRLAELTSTIDKPALLLEAQFYMRELERRFDSRASLRDLILEVIVIALIGWEIHMSYRQDLEQTAAMAQQQKIWTNMQASSEATANTILSLQETTKMISAAVQQELNLNYQVSLYFAYDLPNKRINIVNNSRTSVAVWGYRLDRKDEFFHEPIVISVHAMANLDNKEFFEKSSKEIPRQPRNVFHTTPFVLYLRSADGKDFEADCTLHAGWQENGFEVSMSNSSIKTSDWSAKARTPAQ